jgi:lipopolysaccharide/colanic/teichoic acid biosynthesis glycosyltransferase
MAIQSALSADVITVDVGYRRAKRVLDVTFTLLILLPLCIIIALVAVVIWLDSKGPIFFRQKRIGQNGVTFEMLKFRSMYHQCDDELHRQAIERYMADQPLNDSGDRAELQFKLVEDPRITRVGRFLRKSSIDELPQFFNVLRNEMSLVGPRPPLPYEVERYSEHDLLRLHGKPGLTGPWQVYGRCRVPFSAMVEMDIAYLQKQSLWEDIKLIVLTVPVVIRGDGGV